MKSAALLEILFFATIAFVLITKLLDMLGQTDEDDPMKGKSFFGEPGASPKVRNVTAQEPDKDTFAGRQTIAAWIKKISGNSAKYDHLISTNDEIDKARILRGLLNLEYTLKAFNPIKFLDASKGAFNMLIQAVSQNEQEIIDFLTTISFNKEIKDLDVTSLKHGAKLIDAKFADVSKFGNSGFVKILFSLDDQRQEEWTFTKNINDQTDPSWKISNITAT